MENRAKSLLRSRAEIEARREEKQARLLAWLRIETFTTREIAGEVLQLKRNATTKTLEAMVREELLKAHVIEAELGRKTIYGLTVHGAAVVSNDDDENPAWFVSSRLSASTLVHDLWAQKLHLRAEQSGWTDWRSERFLRRTIGQVSGKSKWLKVPDGVGTNCAGEIVAVEVERTLKSPERYKQVMFAYLAMIKKGLISRVEYVCISPVVYRRLPKIFANIKELPFGGEKLKLEAKHYAKFSFHSAANWPVAGETKAATKGHTAIRKT